MHIRRWIFFLSALFIFSCTQSQNWPGWRGENRDARVPDFEMPGNWPDQLKKIWQKPVGLGDASIVLVDGKLFLSVRQDSAEAGLCLDAFTGETLWKTVLHPAPEVTGGARSHPGPRSTPAVFDNKVYLIGTGGILSCLNASDGKIIWKNETFTEVPAFYAGMSPLITNNLCIVHLNGKENGTIVAFHAGTGEIAWSVKGEPSTYSSPVIMKVNKEEIIILQSETDVVGISKSGNILFKIPTPCEQRFYNSSTPVIDGDNIIVCGQGAGTRSFQIEQNGSAYSWKENWTNPEYGVSFNTPVLKNGYLYGHEARLGKAYCLNARTGKTCWADTTAHNRFVSTLDLGEILLSLPATGKLLFFEPNPESFIQKAIYKIADTEVYAHPVVTGNRIYVKEQDLLTCWTIKDF